MMTVLNTMEIMDVNPWAVRLVICGIIAGILSLVVLAASDFESYAPIICLAVSGAFLVAAILSVIVLPEVPTGKFQIEATFTDDFSFNSVLKEYDIVEQRGDIFVLEPKEREVG